MKHLTYVFLAGLMLIVVGCSVSTEDVDIEATVPTPAPTAKPTTVPTPAPTTVPTAVSPVSVKVCDWVSSYAIQNGFIHLNAEQAPKNQNIQNLVIEFTPAIKGFNHPIFNGDITRKKVKRDFIKLVNDQLLGRKLNVNNQGYVASGKYTLSANQFNFAQIKVKPDIANTNDKNKLDDLQKQQHKWWSFTNNEIKTNIKNTLEKYN